MSNDSEESKATIEKLRFEYNKNVRALKRLDAFYLYDDDGMDNADFAKKKHELEDEIRNQEAILAKYDGRNDDLNDMDEEEFEAKASYVIMSKMLTGEFDASYDIVCKTLDQMVLQRFFKTIVDRIGIVDGRVAWIRFRNGITHKIMY